MSSLSSFSSGYSGYLRCIGVPTLDRVFGGTLLQRIECCDCGHLSTCFEPFLDLSLPICKGHSSHHANKKQAMSKSQQKRAKKTKKVDFFLKFPIILVVQKNHKGKGKKRKESTCESEATAPSENGICNGDAEDEEEKDTLADELDELELKEKDEEERSGGLFFPHLPPLIRSFQKKRRRPRSSRSRLAISLAFSRPRPPTRPNPREFWRL